MDTVKVWNLPQATKKTVFAASHCKYVVISYRTLYPLLLLLFFHRKSHEMMIIPPISFLSLDPRASRIEARRRPALAWLLLLLLPVCLPRRRLRSCSCLQPAADPRRTGPVPRPALHQALGAHDHGCSCARRSAGRGSERRSCRRGRQGIASTCWG